MTLHSTSDTGAILGKSLRVYPSRFSSSVDRGLEKVTSLYQRHQRKSPACVKIIYLWMLASHSHGKKPTPLEGLRNWNQWETQDSRPSGPTHTGVSHHEKNDRQNVCTYLNHFLLFHSVFSTKNSWSNRNSPTTIMPIGAAFCPLEPLSPHPPNAAHFHMGENSTPEHTFFWIHHFSYKLSLLKRKFL